MTLMEQDDRERSTKRRKSEEVVKKSSSRRVKSQDFLTSKLLKIIVDHPEVLYLQISLITALEIKVKTLRNIK